MSVNFLLLAAFGGFVLLLLAALPAWAVARPARAARIRGAPVRRVALWWVAAVAPWLALWLVVVTHQAITVDADTLGETAAVAAVGLVLYGLMVALPVAVITATVIWMAGRRRVVPGPGDGGESPR
ncbi:MAG TPA: hypothetical protein VKA84_07965 [Gemmatimonadaceae bacterium]|nr:hypothetical protein [Gemmatimonadaceae bacterium]